MHEAKERGDEPAPAQVRPQHVLERHVDDRRGDQYFDERRKPCALRHHAIGRGEEGDRMRQRERGDDAYQRPAHASKRQDEAKQEQQVIYPIGNMGETGLHE